MEIEKLTPEDIEKLTYTDFAAENGILGVNTSRERSGDGI